MYLVILLHTIALNFLLFISILFHLMKLN